MDVTDADEAGGPNDRLLPWSQVRIIAGLSRTTIWRLQKTGDFPAAVQVSPNRVGWWQSELLAWKRARTPRRLPEPRIVEAVLMTPRVRAPEDKVVATPKPTTTESQDQGPPASSRRRRKPSISPDQGAFDF